MWIETWHVYNPPTMDELIHDYTLLKRFHWKKQEFTVFHWHSHSKIGKIGKICQKCVILCSHSNKLRQLAEHLGATSHSPCSLKWDKVFCQLQACFASCELSFCVSLWLEICEFQGCELLYELRFVWVAITSCLGASMNSQVAKWTCISKLAYLRWPTPLFNRWQLDSRHTIH